MARVFVLQNQHKQFLSKQGQWTDGRDVGCLYRTEHKDEAINQVFEVSSKDYTLRVTSLVCELNERGQPLLAPEHLPPVALEEEANADLALENAETAANMQRSDNLDDSDLASGNAGNTPLNPAEPDPSGH